MKRRIQTLAFLLTLATNTAFGQSNGVDELWQKAPGQNIWGDSLPRQVLDLMVGDGFSRSHALVVGISRYQEFDDLNTANDPIAMARHLLEVQNFDTVRVLTEEYVTLERIRSLMEDELPAIVDENDRFLFYWSGHGDTRQTQTIEKGYLVLSNSGRNRYSQMIDMDDLRRWNDLLGARQVLFLMDSCFSGLAGTQTKSGSANELTSILSEPSRHIMTAGTGDQETIVIDQKRMSLFTSALLDGLSGRADASTSVRDKDGVITLTELFSHVRYQVDQERRAVNWNDAITPQLRTIGVTEGEFFFLAPGFTNTAPPVTVTLADPNQDKRQTKGVSTPSKDIMAPEVKAPGERSSPVRPEFIALGNPGKTFRDCDVCPEMVPLPRGEFTMGSAPSDHEGTGFERPLHWVRHEPFAMAKSEITFDQWTACVADRACIPPDDNGWGRGSRPVINITYAEANAYISWLNTKANSDLESGQIYRLPSEAEWEYAARAGTVTRYPWGNDWSNQLANGREGKTITPDIIRDLGSADSFPEAKAMAGVGELLDKALGDMGNASGSNQEDFLKDLEHQQNQILQDLIGGMFRGGGARATLEDVMDQVSRTETKPVGSYPPNAWGLFDMIGNVNEWTADCWYDTYHNAPLDGQAIIGGGNCPNGNRTVRGGSGFETPPQLRSAQRFSVNENTSIPWMGFRPIKTLIRSSVKANPN